MLSGWVLNIKKQPRLGLDDVGWFQILLKAKVCLILDHFIPLLSGQTNHFIYCMSCSNCIPTCSPNTSRMAQFLDTTGEIVAPGGEKKKALKHSPSHHHFFIGGIWQFTISNHGWSIKKEWFTMVYPRTFWYMLLVGGLVAIFGIFPYVLGC